MVGYPPNRSCDSREHPEATPYTVGGSLEVEEMHLKRRMAIEVFLTSYTRNMVLAWNKSRSIETVVTMSNGSWDSVHATEFKHMSVT